MQGFNFQRKIFHLSGFILPLIYYLDLFKGAFGLTNATRAIIFLGLLFVIISLSITEFFRLTNPGFKEFFYSKFGALMKKEEEYRMTATIPYMVSNAVVVLFFPPEFFFLSNACLLIGDPVAAYFGSRYGKYRFYNGKSLIGVVAFILGAFLAQLLFLYFFYMTRPESSFAITINGELNTYAVFTALCSAIVAGLAEFFSGHTWKGFLDDNLTIPLASAVTILLVFSFTKNIELQQLIFQTGDLFK